MIYKFSGNNNGGVSFIQKLCNQLIQRDSSSDDYTLLYLLQFSVMNISYLLVKFQLWIPLLLNWAANLAWLNMLLRIWLLNMFWKLYKTGLLNVASNNLSQE